MKATDATANEQIDSEVIRSESFWSNVFRRLRKNRLTVISFWVLLSIVLLCIFVPVLSPYGMETTDATSREMGPAASHWLGTDKIGRDLFTRLFYGGRVSLGVALSATAIQCVIGIILGSLSGFYGGIVDTIIMRIAEMFSSFPFTLMCITIVAIFGPGVTTLVVTLSILMWPSIARIVRGQILVLREQEYMEACEALGISDMRRIFRHLFPNVLSYIIVYATLGMANAILVESTLSFLGLGISPPTPSWGNMIETARNLLVIQNKWWFWIPPGIAIFLSVMCFNLLGDGLRDAIDPKMKR